MKEIPTPWAIEKLERLRHERAERERSRLELPVPGPPPRAPGGERRRTAIVIQLR